MQTSETEERFSVCLIIIIIRSITHEVGPKKKKKLDKESKEKGFEQRTNKLLFFQCCWNVIRRQ